MKIRILSCGFSLPGQEIKDLAAKNVLIDTSSVSGFSSASAKTLTEYDIIIFDLPTGLVFPQKRFEQLDRFLNQKRGILIYVLNEYSYNISDKVDNYRILEQLLQLENIDTVGLRVVQSPSSKLSITPQGETSGIAGYLKNSEFGSNTYIEFTDDNIIPLGKNVDDNIVAFTYKQLRNQLFAIPPRSPYITLDLLQYSVEILSNKRPDNIKVADWVYDFTIPGTEKLREKMAKIEENISERNNELSDVRIKYDQLEHYRNVLLFGTGDILHEVVISVLNEMGIDAQRGPEGDYDVEINHKKEVFVIEVKGKNKSASLDNVRQVVDWKTNYEFENDNRSAKGILLINTWRKENVLSRGKDEFINFPDNVITAAKRNRICLVTSSQLFVVYCNWKNKVFKRKEINTFVADLLKTDEVYHKHENIKEFFTS